MMSTLVERFRYRFELWLRERREDSFWGGTWPELSFKDDPKHVALLRESNLKSIVRLAVAYFGTIALAAGILGIIARSFPSARFTLRIVFIVFVGLWTFAMIVSEIDFRKARKRYREHQKAQNI